jgi:hypothetical protein
VIHVSVGVVDCPVAPFAGADNAGAAGGGGTVVKLLFAEYELVPPTFVALTCQ